MCQYQHHISAMCSAERGLFFNIQLSHAFFHAMRQEVTGVMRGGLFNIQETDIIKPAGGNVAELQDLLQLF